MVDSRAEIEANGETLTLVLGSAANQSVHIRRADEGEVYLARGLSEWSIRGDDASYYERQYVEVEPSEVVSLRLSNENGVIELTKTAERWQLAGEGASEALDLEAVEALVGAVLTLRIAEPVGEADQPQYGLDAGHGVDWTLTGADQSVGGSYRVGTSDGGF